MELYGVVHEETYPGGQVFSVRHGYVPMNDEPVNDSVRDKHLVAYMLGLNEFNRFDKKQTAITKDWVLNADRTK